MFNEIILKNDEKAIFALRSLYKQYGYLPFKMSKFEEYDLYVRNKDFLIDDSVITFNDTNGRLLALKPDVTLSIIKNTVDKPGCKQKVYYDENVYRVSGSTHQFKEIMQSGIECIGDTDITDTLEVTSLALKSLARLSSDFSLDVAHLGILSAIFDGASESKTFKKEATALIGDKNKHELAALCDRYAISSSYKEKLIGLIDLYGSVDTVLARLDTMLDGEREREALSELRALAELLSGTGHYDRVRLDFSVVNDMAYYNGIVFKGFINGIYESVLSGGEYAPLMRRMGRKSRAIGFAVYVDLLERLEGASSEYDVDVLLIYGDNTRAEALIKAKEELVAHGKTVSAQKAIPDKLRYRELVDISKEGV